MKKIEIAVAAALAGVVMSGAAAQDAVQWRVEDGGNGHWYAVIIEQETTAWTAARSAAMERGGDLASLESEMEQQWAFTSFGPDPYPNAWNNQLQPAATQFGPWIGGVQDPDGEEPLGGWHWLTGVPFNPSGPTCCNDLCSSVRNEDRLHLYRGSGSTTVTWNDIPDDPEPCSSALSQVSALIEWSADCNGDGIVDYGQILDGTYPDEDGNGVPDCCDEDVGCDCPADITGDGQVDAADLGVLLAVWNTDGGAIPGADINGDGTVNASDLGLVLGAWGLCS